MSPTLSYSVPVQVELLLASSLSNRSLIPGGSSSCFWVLVRALRLFGNKELQAVMLVDDLGGAYSELQYLLSSASQCLC